MAEDPIRSRATRGDFGRAGIPYQFTQLIDAEPENLMAGDVPCRSGIDFPAADGIEFDGLEVVGLNVDGKIELATYSPVGAYATGQVALTGNPQSGDNVSTGGTTYRFVVSPSVANDVAIGANASASVDNLVSAINNGAHGGGVPNTRVNAYRVANSNVVHLATVAMGLAGNSLGIVASASARTGVSAFSGGLGGIVPIGITAQALPIDETNRYIGVWVSGVFNPTRLTWHDSFNSWETRKFAFQAAPAYSRIMVRRTQTNTVTV